MGLSETRGTLFCPYSKRILLFGDLNGSLRLFERNPTIWWSIFGVEVLLISETPILGVVAHPRIQGSRFGVWGLGLGVWGLGFEV